MTITHNGQVFNPAALVAKYMAAGKISLKQPEPVKAATRTRKDRPDAAERKRISLMMSCRRQYAASQRRTIESARAVCKHPFAVKLAKIEAERANIPAAAILSRSRIRSVTQARANVIRELLTGGWTHCEIASMWQAGKSFARDAMRGRSTTQGRTMNET